MTVLTVLTAIAFFIVHFAQINININDYLFDDDD